MATEHAVVNSIKEKGWQVIRVTTKEIVKQKKMYQKRWFMKIVAEKDTPNVGDIDLVGQKKKKKMSTKEKRLTDSEQILKVFTNKHKWCSAN